MNRRLHHVALVVRSIAEGFGFYRDKLGLPLIEVKRLEDQGVLAALLALENTELELLEPIDPKGGVARYLERRGEGLHHLCLTTPDLPAELATLRSRGVELIDQEPRWGLAGLIAFVHPRVHTGVLVELVEEKTRPSRHAETEASCLRLDAVSVAARDLDAALVGWQEASGLAAAEVRENATLGASVARIAVGDLAIEVCAPANAASALAAEIEARGEGMLGLHLATSALDDVVQRLRDAGVAVARRNSKVAIDRGETFGVPIEICGRLT